jgi:hypothetical protein
MSDFWRGVLVGWCVAWAVSFLSSAVLFWWGTRRFKEVDDYARRARAN